MWRELKEEMSAHGMEGLEEVEHRWISEYRYTRV
jgi:hypothetical protein